MPLLRRGDSTEKPEPVQGRKVQARDQDKIDRGRVARDKDRHIREMCVRFFEGDQNSVFGAKNQILRLAEITTAQGGKEPHRIRNKYNFVGSIVEGKVSASTQRVPGYEVIQTTTDHADYAAARLSEKVATALYDQLNLRRTTTKVVTDALVQREGFALAYFDPNVGPFVPEITESGDVEWIGMGEVKVATYNRSEVMWEPGEDFEDSRWYATEQEMLIEKIEQIPGFVGGKVASDVPDNSSKAILTTYYERPCKDYPEGRMYHMANGHAITPEDRYPVRDHNDEVVDRPVLRRLSYTVNPNGDDLGLVERIIDLQRTINDCWNKLLEWKNRCLMPKATAPRGADVDRMDDSPGQLLYYNPINGQKFEWERPPAVPRELFDMLDLAISHMRALAADVDVQPEADLAAKTANAAIEQSQARWQSFLGDLAQFHAGLAGDILTLVARHYTDERLVEIRGDYSWIAISDFRGQNLRGQTSVRVRPATLESKGRTRVIEDLSFMAQNYPNAIPMEAAWSGLQGGLGEGLLVSYEKDIAAAWRLVETLNKGPEHVFSLPKRLDPDLMVQVPGYMPRKQHNTVIFKQVLADRMKSDDFDDLPPETQHLYDLVWQELERLEQARAMAAVMKEQEAAASLGLANAASPQPDAALPAEPGLSREQGAPAPPS